MLSSSTPYPQVGSHGLIEHEGKTRLAWIIGHKGADLVVSLPNRRGAAGILTVPAERILDGTPLTDDERIELDRLGRAGRRGKNRARYDSLRLRDIRSEALADLLAAHPKSKRAA